MAKTSKTVKRTATSSSSKGSTGKKKGFLGRSFNLQSRKVQFFVVILIVAILGGGYFTYRSFAATVVASWRPGSNVWVQNNGSCQFQTINDTVGANKSSVPVWNVACPANALTVINGKSGDSTFMKLTGIYQVCASIKGGGKITMIHDGTVYKTNTITVINDGKYREYCSDSAGSASQSQNHSAVLRIEPSTWVNVSELYLSQVQLGTPTNNSSK